MRQTGQALFAFGVLILLAVLAYAFTMLLTLLQGDMSLLNASISPRGSEVIGLTTAVGCVLFLSGAAMSKP